MYMNRENNSCAIQNRSDMNCLGYVFFLIMPVN